MPYRALINEFMIDKAHRIDKEKIYSQSRSYYTKKDSRSILNWEERKAENVVYELIKGIEFTLQNFGNVSVFSNKVCPFCIANGFTGDIEDIFICLECEYAKVHGYCHDSTSDYAKTRTGEVLWEPVYEIFDKNYFIEQYIKLKNGLNSKWIK